MPPSSLPEFPPSDFSTAPANAPVNFETLLRKLDGDFGALHPSVIKQFRFDLDGLSFDVRRIRQQEGHHFLITAQVGYLPFSVESAERRAIIETIILASRALPTVRFSVSSTSKITAGAIFNLRHGLETPDFIFYPLTLFLQEAQPFIRLIGQYLTAAPKPRVSA